MKKTTFLLFSMLVLAFVNVKAAYTESNYVIDDSKVEALMASSTQLFATDVAVTAENEASNDVLLQNFSNSNNVFGKTMYKKQGSSRSAIAAIVIDFFIGSLGIHRAYLGTKTFTWIGYILTCGGIFGLVPFVDLIVLIINIGDIS
jgi:hypothetical protein